MLDDDEKLEFIIDMAGPTEEFEDYANDANLMNGCMSSVWLTHEVKDGKYYFRGTSNSVLVRGIVQMIVKSFSGHTAEEIQQIPADIFTSLDLRSLTMQRRAGMEAMLKHLWKVTSD